MVSPLLGRDPVGVFPIGGRGCDGAEHQSALGKRGLSSVTPLWAMQGLGAGRSAATTRALETKGRHRSPTIVVSDLCNVTSLMGHSFRHGVTAMQTLERLIIMGGANSRMGVGVGRLNEIKAAKPTTGGTCCPPAPRV
jgi:hypothetical protein